VYDAISSKGEEDGPVEAKDNDEEEDGHNHLVHRFNGGHSSADRECSEQHSQTMTQHRPVAVLCVCVSVHGCVCVGSTCVKHPPSHPPAGHVTSLPPTCNS